MAMFYCFECDNLYDGDRTESYEWGDDEICIDCHMGLTPEDFEDWILTHNTANPVGYRWELVHKNYDGPEDGRFFCESSIAQAWERAIEYNEVWEPEDR